ncbi:MAG: alpha/beta fold hydrolase [Panacagrimonas sp.]|jgi:predicted alpha/beta hydrolase|nr:alpha/beta fold hydrolase [Panacagrimonas sp.]MCC2656304.1 alpha/beta fold hydrolase [Panacagrimonas sp.]
MRTPQPLDVVTEDGHRFGGTLHRAADPDAPLLMFMPAMGTRARYYNGFGAALAQAGVSFACFDWRGIDTSSQRASRTLDFGYRHLVEHDFPAALQVLHARLPSTAGRTFIGGHSLGGQLAALFTARAPESVKGVVLIASGNVHFRGWRGTGSLRILALTQSASLISRVVGHFPGKQLRFGGQEARGVIRDWASTARNGRYRLAGSNFDYEAGMARLQKPVLAVGFTADTLAPAGSTDRLLAKLAHCSRTHLRWKAVDTGGVALDHFSWAKRPELVVPTVASWIRNAPG